MLPSSRIAALSPICLYAFPRLRASNLGARAFSQFGRSKCTLSHLHHYFSLVKKPDRRYQHLQHNPLDSLRAPIESLLGPIKIRRLGWKARRAKGSRDAAVINCDLSKRSRRRRERGKRDEKRDPSWGTDRSLNCDLARSLAARSNFFSARNSREKLTNNLV